MNIPNGAHKIIFRDGNLYLDGIQIGGNEISPKKEIVFDFIINRPDEEVEEIINKDPSILEINVFDAIPTKDLGPGQSK